MQSFFENGNQKVHRNSGPDLDPYRVLGSAVEGLDSQMLVDPFEKQFDLPTTAIELSNGQCRFGEVVGQKDQSLAGQRIAKTNASQSLRIVLAWVETARDHGLVETQTDALVHRAGVTAPGVEVLPGPRDKERPAQVQAIKPGKVQIASVDNVESSGLVDQIVENVDFVNQACGQDDHAG